MSVAGPLPATIPYDYWCMGKEERSRMEERKERREYQVSISTPSSGGYELRK